MCSRKLRGAAAKLQGAAARVLCLASFAMLTVGLTAGASRGDTPSLSIEGLKAIANDDQIQPGDATLRLNDRIAIILKCDGVFNLDPTKAQLFLNGHSIGGLTDIRFLPQQRALVVGLVRGGDNASDWNPVLGSPGLWPRPVSVAVVLDKSACGTASGGTSGATGTVMITGADGKAPYFRLVLIRPLWLVFGIVAVLLVVLVVWIGASRTTLLKDSLLPQLAPKLQPFSLGRSQMAFWFMLVFAVYVFLFFALGDYNTVTPQALTLMGLSGATAIFAIAVDAAKDSPIGAANETLRAIGLATYADYVRLVKDIATKQADLVVQQAALALLRAAQPPDPAAILVQQTRVDLLTSQINDALSKKWTYDDITPRFVSTGWYRDLTTDINGPALHRLQMFVWTLLLGVIFLIEAYRTLAMPEFSATLLSLMGVTSAGYIGFKFPEQQH